VTDLRPSFGRDALALTLIAALIAGFAAFADAAAGAPQYITPHQEETFKPYIARVYFDTKANDGSDAYFEILKDDKQVYVQRAKNKGEKFFIGTMYKEDPDAPLVKMGMDVTGDGKPDLVVSEWSGYANCCLTLHIFEIGPTFKKLGTIDAEFSDSGPHFIPPDKRSQTLALAVQIHDWNFANWHTDFADSPAPKVLLRFSNGAYRIAPDLMRTQAPDAQDLDTRAAAVRSYAPSAKGGTWPHAEVSPDLWSTMLDLIYGGHDAEAWKFLDTAWPSKVNGKDVFARDFRAQLAKSPYWPAVKTMNASSSPTSPRAAAE
jgi:hypothetical protein